MIEETPAAAPPVQHRLLTDALVYTGANLVTAAIPFLMLPILTRTLTPEEYGIVAMFTVSVAFFGALTGLSVHGAIGIRYFELSRATEFPRYVATCMLILALSTGATLTAAWLTMPLLSRVTSLPPFWVAAAVLASSAQFVVQVQLSIWQSAKRPWRFGGLRLLQAALDAGLSLVLVVALGLSWQGRLGGIALAAALVCLLAAGLMWWKGWFLLPPSKAYAANALRFGVPLIPHALGGLLISIVDRLLITNVLDVGSTGVYMVALQIGMVLGLLTDSFNKAFAPWLIENLRHTDKARDISIVRFTYLYFVAVLLFALLVSVLATPILHLIAGEKFLHAEPLIRYIIFGYAFGGMYYMVTNYVFFAGRTELLSVLTFVTGALNVSLTYCLLQRNGLLGAAQGFMTAQMIVFCCTWLLAQHCRPMPWRSALAPKRIPQ